MVSATWLNVYPAKRFRSFDGGMERDSLYLAIVLRATTIPFFSKRSVIFLSLRGFVVFSAAISFLIIALIAVDEHSPPPFVET